MQGWYDIPKDLIINFDQTSFPYIYNGNRTYAKKGPFNVPLVGKGRKKKKQIMGTFTVGTSGSFLPMQPIYQGIINLCLAKGVDFPAEFDVTCTANHWSNESQAIQKIP